jgi:hypothetical protein
MTQIHQGCDGVFPAVGDWPVHILSVREARNTLIRYIPCSFNHRIYLGRKTDSPRGILAVDTITQVEFYLSQRQEDGQIYVAETAELQVLRPPSEKLGHHDRSHSRSFELCPGLSLLPSAATEESVSVGQMERENT